MSYCGLQAKIATTHEQTEQRSDVTQQLRYASPGYQNQTKIDVSPAAALTFGAFYGGVRLLTQCQASLPMDLYERKGTGLADVKVHEHPVSYLLQREPNTYQTPVLFREQRKIGEYLWGDSFAEQRFVNGIVADLQCHQSKNVQPFWSPTRRDRFGRPILMYQIWDEFTKEYRIIDSSMMIHVPYFGFNGITGTSVVKLGAQALGIGISTDRTAATFFGNSARPYLFVEAPNGLTDDQAERLKRDLRQSYTGDSAYSSMVLENGMKATYANMPLKDAQFLESRKFSGEEIAARWLGLPPHLAGYLDQSNYATMSEQNRAFVMFRLTPECIRDEQELNRKLLSRDERERFYIKYSVDGLLRGTQKDRYEAHRNALMSGWKTINEVRELEDLPPLPGGDELAKPAAVYGQPTDDPQPTEDDPKPEDKKPETEKKSSINLRSLVQQTIESQATAERIWIERMKLGHDSMIRAREYYEQQISKLIDRIPGSNPETIRRYYERHLADVNICLCQKETKSELMLAAEGWKTETSKLADELLGV
jgi:HK97 family phage portal protein